MSLIEIEIYRHIPKNRVKIETKLLILSNPFYFNSNFISIRMFHLSNEAQGFLISITLAEIKLL